MSAFALSSGGLARAETPFPARRRAEVPACERPRTRAPGSRDHEGFLRRIRRWPQERWQAHGVHRLRVHLPWRRFRLAPEGLGVPSCGSLKNRFKVYQEGNAYDQLAAQKKANRAALAAKKKGAPSKRQLLKQKMMEEQAAMDKKKGGFFGR